MSDACVADVLLTMASILPLPNNCPTMSAYKEYVKPEIQPVTIPITSGICYILPFDEIVSNILRRHPYAVNLHHERLGGLSDIKDGSLCPEIKSNVLYFIINTDGISPIRSRNLHVWPIILSMINLKPNHRRMLKNLILASLYVGESQPVWSEILPHVVAQIKSGVEFGRLHYACEIVCLVADMPAKSSICNIQHPTAK